MNKALWLILVLLSQVQVAQTAEMRDPFASPVVKKAVEGAVPALALGAAAGGGAAGVKRGRSDSSEGGSSAKRFAAIAHGISPVRGVHQMSPAKDGLFTPYRGIIETAKAPGATLFNTPQRADIIATLEGASGSPAREAAIAVLKRLPLQMASNALGKPEHELHPDEVADVLFDEALAHDKAGRAGDPKALLSPTRVLSVCRDRAGHDTSMILPMNVGHIKTVVVKDEGGVFGGHLEGAYAGVDRLEVEGRLQGLNPAINVLYGAALSKEEPAVRKPFAKTVLTDKDFVWSSVIHPDNILAATLDGRFQLRFDSTTGLYFNSIVEQPTAPKKGSSKVMPPKSLPLVKTVYPVITITAEQMGKETVTLGKDLATGENIVVSSAHVSKVVKAAIAASARDTIVYDGPGGTFVSMNAGDTLHPRWRGHVVVQTALAGVVHGGAGGGASAVEASTAAHGGAGGSTKYS